VTAKSAYLSGLCLLSFLSAATVRAESDAEAEVLAVIDEFFTAMTARDVERLASIMTEDGIIYGYSETPEGVRIVRPTHAAYLEGLANREAVPVERYWDPTVLVEERLATVWTPYDFYSDGVFSHCGTNNFSLLKTDDGWVITGVVFSIKTADCPESPLGPFGSGS
jgi:uncharacterized protein (TIGR02246 family)